MDVFVAVFTIALVTLGAGTLQRLSQLLQLKGRNVILFLSATQRCMAVATV
jgi:hypothetical protein